MPLNLKPKYKPIVLTIVDGWGLSTGILGNPLGTFSPNLQRFWTEFPHLALQTYRKLKIPFKSFISSEVAHLSIGGGRMIDPEEVKISQAIEEGLFFRNPILLEACQASKTSRGSLHLFGHLSSKGRDAHLDHLIACLELCKAERVPEVFLHLLLEETPDLSESFELLAKIEENFQHLGLGKMGSLSGINFTIDENNLLSLRQLLKALILGVGKISQNPFETLRELYKTKESPANLPPTLIAEPNQKPALLKDGDSIIFFNLKADKLREFLKSLFDPEWFPKLKIYPKDQPPNLLGVTLTEYFLNLPIKTAFPSTSLKNSLSEAVSQNHLKQLKVTLSSKFPHLTYYFNGRKNQPFPGEERLIVGTSTSNPNEDLPKLIHQVTRLLRNFDLIILNIPNLDLAGHTFDSELILETTKLVDMLVYHLGFEVVKTGGATLLTSDHGSVETSLPLREKGVHTFNPVPLILVASGLRKNLLQSAIQSVLSQGLLADILRSHYTIADIAPTCLDLLNLEKPPEMEGISLLPALGIKKGR